MPISASSNDKHRFRTRTPRSWLALALLVQLVAVISTSMHAPALADDSSLFQSGVDLYNHQNWRSAMRQFDLAAQSNNRLPTARYYKALCHQRLGEYAAANVIFQDLCDRYPASPEARLAATVLSRSSAPQVVSAPISTPGSKDDKTPSAASSLSALRALMRKDATELTDREWESLPDHSSVPFTRGHGNHMYVNVQINGRTVSAIFDTGAELCLFSKADLDRAGVKIEAGGRPVAMSGVGGSSIGTAQMANLKLGDIERHIEIVYQAGLPTPSLLGESFFKPFDYEIDSRGGLIKLSKKTRDGQSRASEPYDTIVIPYEPAGENMVVKAQINGRPIDMIFDTGAAGVTMSPAHMMMLGLTLPEDAQVGYNMGIGGHTRSFQFPVREIRLGPISRTNVPVNVLENGPSLPLLGQRFFGDRRFSIDNKKRVIKFWR